MESMTRMEWMQVAIFLYIALIVIIGMAMFKLVQKSGKRYVVCGKTIPMFILTTMLLAQALDANGTMGATGAAYAGGFWAGFILPAGVGMCLVVTALFFAKPLNEMNLLTLPDFYFRRFDSTTEWLSSIVMILSFIVLVAGNLAGSGWIVAYVFDLDYTWALIIISTLIFVYTICGGLFSSAGTNVVQIFPACIGFIAAVLWLLHMHGWDYFAAALPELAGSPENYYNLTGFTRIENGALLNYAGLMAVGLGDVIALDFMERVFAAKNGRIARDSCLVAAGITFIVGTCTAMLGILAYAVFAEANVVVDDPRMILPVMSLDILPFGLGVLVITGILGAGTSTASGGLVGVSTALGRNIYQKNLYLWWLKRQGIHEIVHHTEADRNKFDARLLLISRVVTIPVVMAAIWLAHVKPEPGILLILAFDIGFAACVPSLFLGVYWKKANAKGAIASIFAGGITRIILHFTIPEDSVWLGIESLVSPVVGLVVMWFVSLATQESCPPKPQALDDRPDETDVLAGLA